MRFDGHGFQILRSYQVAPWFCTQQISSINSSRTLRRSSVSANIDIHDKDGFHEVTKDLDSDQVSVVLHSPGGSAEAADSLVALLRSRFKDVQFIVPRFAKSAATMLAMSGDRILMDELSELGPIDPQMIFTRNGETIVAPLQSIRDQFRLAQDEVKDDADKLRAWMPILQQYGPALLIQCDNQIELAKALVKGWLASYMFRNDPDAATKSGAIAEFLANDKNFLSHSRRIGIDELREQGVVVNDLRDHPALREAVHELYISMALTFQNTGALKISENSRGKALIRIINIQPAQPQNPHAAPADLPSPGGLSRQQRRQQERRDRKH